jgi:glycosyltransferase involved in cell wall biosynthesis
MPPSAPPEPPAREPLEKIGDLAAAAGIRAINVLAWRDLDDPEAGGSEVHIHEVMSRWADAGISVTMRTSFASGQPVIAARGGYRVIRRAGRYLVFPRAAASEALRRHGPADALVEVWNGIPFLSPLWHPRRPRLALLHHLHTELWSSVLAPTPARLGDLFERRVAPLAYRHTPVATLSESSRRDLLDRTWMRPDQVHVVPPGIDPRFVPRSGARHPDPLVVAVGRLVPAKRFDLLLDAMARLRDQGQPARLVVVGDGYERDALRGHVSDLGLDAWVELRGHVGDDELVELYQSAWVVASASSSEGWGMSLTEAAACGTPAVATRIAGHLDAVHHGRTGLLVEPAGLSDALGQVLGDDSLRARLQRQAGEAAAGLSWEQTALSLLRLMADQVTAAPRP